MRNQPLEFNFIWARAHSASAHCDLFVFVFARVWVCVFFVEQVTLIEIESKSINEANIIFCVLFTQCDFYQQQRQPKKKFSEWANEWKSHAKHQQKKRHTSFKYLTKKWSTQKNKIPKQTNMNLLNVGYQQKCREF